MADRSVHGPYTIIQTKQVYQNPWINVREDQVCHENGQKGIFGIVKLIEGATVLAINDQREVYLVEEFKYALGRSSIELVSGGLDAGETPLEAAKRELTEEVGLVAEHWVQAGVVNPFTTVIDSPNYMFIATSLSQGTCHPDAWESLRVITMPLDQAIDLAVKGEIVHAASCMLLLKAHYYLPRLFD